MSKAEPDRSRAGRANAPRQTRDPRAPQRGEEEEETADSLWGGGQHSHGELTLQQHARPQPAGRPHPAAGTELPADTGAQTHGKRP